MTLRDGKLYDLLPAVHRIRDAEGRADGLDGNLPLRSLLSIVAREVAVVEEDLAQLYDDLFVETCAEWVVPYIGDLVGVGGLHDLKGAASRRAQVANTVAYRRRKGTVAILEGLARDATGWPAHAAEFFRVLATTQHVNHVRPSNLYSPDLRRWKPLEYVNTPFDELPHTADVRHIASGRGRHNIPNVGIFLWRLHPYELRRSPAVRVDGHRYLFNPLGTDTQLFTKPEAGVAQLSKPINVPMPIGRRLLHERLSEYYGPGKSVHLEVDEDEKDPALVMTCNLGDVPGGGWAHTPPEGKIAIDPVLGRIAFPEALSEGAEVLVTYHYGFSADIGGGEYDRAASLGAGTPRRVRAAELASITGDGVVEITDSGRFDETLETGADEHVELRAADGRRPTLALEGDFEIEGGTDAEVTLNGLLIAGGALKVSGDLRRLRLLHCTLVPGIRLRSDGEPEKGSEPSLQVEAEGVEVEIHRCILGGMRIEAGSEARVTDSIIDATNASNVAYAAKNGAGGRLRIENSTVIGSVNTEVLELASNTIFLGRVTARRKQEGCARFSYLPLGSEVPRKHRCRPEDEPESERVRPQFASLRYGDPGYCQLSRWCAAEIRRGADDESEMGAFHDLYAPQREANLRTRLDEYLRFGLEAGILYAT